MKTDILIDGIEPRTEIKAHIHIDTLFLITNPKLHVRERQQLHETLLINWIMPCMKMNKIYFSSFTKTSNPDRSRTSVKVLIP